MGEPCKKENLCFAKNEEVEYDVSDEDRRLDLTKEAVEVSGI